MSIEIGGEGMGFEALLASVLGSVPVKDDDWEPNPERYMAVLDLMKDHQKRLDESRNDTEQGMLTPRITMRDHNDMHLIMTAFDSYMTEVTNEWYNAVTAHAIGNQSETLEHLTLRSREITGAAQFRHAIDRLHTAWAHENAAETTNDEFPDSYENDRAKWGDDQ